MVTARGTYGLRIEGVPDPERHLHEVPADWPALTVEFGGPPPQNAARPAGTIELDTHNARLWLAEAGCVTITREPLTIRFAPTRPLSVEALLHPFLGLPACIANRWLGRTALHGGAFTHRGRAWALLGDREAGKSATLGQLHSDGVEVLSDDVLILDATHLYAGPRSIDLRADPAALIGGEPLGVIGNRERWRLRPQAGAARRSLGGFVTLEWGDEVRLEPLAADERLRLLIGSSALRPAPEHALTLLDLLAHPALRFVRPRRLETLPELTAQLLDALTG